MNLLLNEYANERTGFRWHRCLAGIISTLSLAFISACSSLIPPGIPSGMANPTVDGTPISAYPERLVYRIDDHRYITIKGDSNCVGSVYYNDTHLGIRTNVADSGRSLGDGIFRGYYAASSENVVIPILKFSQITGALLYIYYSRDGGRNFRNFLRGGYSFRNDGILVMGNTIYSMNLRINENSYNNISGYIDPKKMPSVRYDEMIISQASTFNLDREIKSDPFQPGARGTPISSRDVPNGIQSPSRQTRWNCGEIVGK